MKGFFRQISPRGAVRDFAEQWRAPNPHRWRIAALAAACTASLFLMMSGQEQAGLPALPKVTYFPSLLPGRSEAQILRENAEATRKARAEDAADAAHDAQIRARYKYVGDMFGMDTQKMIAQGDAERDAAKKAQDARNAEILRKYLVR